VPAEDPLVRTPPPVIHTPARIDFPDRRAVPPGAAVVADDDPGVRLLAAAALAGLGFEVRAAENGAEAVDLVRAGGDAVRVAVLDVLMPVMDGKEAVAAIRALRPGLPVIVMSGYSEPDVAGQFRGDGVAGFVQKPFRPADLAACVRRAVARAERHAPAGRGSP
jgi:CheY-like chemotaxis protein